MKELEKGYYYENDTIKLFITKKNIDAKNVDYLKKELDFLDFNSGSLKFVNQVHGSEIQIIKDNENCNSQEKDGLITNMSKVPLLIYTADCVPLIFFDNFQKVVGLAHAGWQGTYKAISVELYKIMVEIYGCKKDNINIIIGPHICSDNYEVSGELIEKFSELNILNYYIEKEGRYFLNLSHINRTLLEKQGVPSSNIIDLKLCTVRDNDKFYSYRKDNKTSKRIGTIIELK